MAFAGGTKASLAELETRLAALEAFMAMAPFNKVHVVTGAPGAGLGNDGDLAADIGDPGGVSTGLFYLKSGGAWASTGFQAWAS